MRIRTRLILTFLLMAGAGFYALVDWMIDEVRPRYMETMEESLIDFSQVMAAMLSEQMAEDQYSGDALHSALDAAVSRRFNARIFDVTKEHVDLRIYVTDANGIVRFDSNPDGDEGQDYSQWNDVYLTLRGKYGARATRTDPDDVGTLILHVAAPVMKHDQIVGVLTVCKPAASVTRFMELAERNIIQAGFTAALVVIFVCILATIWITRPVQTLTAYANAIRDGKRPAPPKVGGGEVGELSLAFEEMRDALEGKQYVENYVQALTHEMKSPLSAVRGAAELLLEDMPETDRLKFIQNIATETARLDSLVERMLLLTSLESRKSLVHVERLELKSIIEDVVDSLRVQCASLQVTIEYDIPDGHAIHGERFAIRHALANLVQNAVEFSNEGGVVRISTAQQGDEIIVHVDDEGPGIPDYAIERVYERFFSLQRPRTGRKSTGLGLAIVAETADLHGGRVTLQNRVPVGARATLILPVHPPAA